MKSMPKRFTNGGQLEPYYVRRVRNEVDICNHLGRCVLAVIFLHSPCLLPALGGGCALLDTVQPATCKRARSAVGCRGRACLLPPAGLLRPPLRPLLRPARVA